MSYLERFGAALLAAANLLVVIYVIASQEAGILIFLATCDALLAFCWVEFGSYWNDPSKPCR